MEGGETVVRMYWMREQSIFIFKRYANLMSAAIARIRGRRTTLFLLFYFCMT